MNIIYVLIIVTVLISSYTPFIKQEILNDFSILEQIIYTNIILLIITLPLYFFYEKKTCMYLLHKTKSEYFTKLIIYSLIIIVGLITSGYILQNFKSVIRYKGIQRSLSIILLTIIGCCIYKETFTIKMLSGIISILFGIYLLER